LGIQFGWQPRPDGGIQYMIGLTPEALDALRSGEPIDSDIQPEVLREVRSIRIMVDNKPLARKLPRRPSAAAIAASVAVPAAVPAVLPSNPAGKPLAEQPAVFAASAPAAGPAAANAPGKPVATPVVENSATAEKPWLSLWLTVVALFASMGANIFLGWITWDVRSRYRSLLESAVA
jgi:hypothetical protein